MEGLEGGKQGKEGVGREGVVGKRVMKGRSGRKKNEAEEGKVANK